MFKCKIDPNIVTVGEHHDRFARRNIKAWLASAGLPYHSPHKFRHGRFHYGLERAKTMADYKAVSMNVMHTNIQITDQVYSWLNDNKIHIRVEQLGKKQGDEQKDLEEDFNLFQHFLEWRRQKK